MKVIRNLILELSALFLVAAAIIAPQFASVGGFKVLQNWFSNSNMVVSNLFTGFPGFNSSAVSGFGVPARTFASAFFPSITGNVEPTPQMVDKVSPSVVSVFGESSSADNGFGIPGMAMTTMTAGTGFFVDSSGYILTNKHVVEDMNADFSVVLSDGTSKEAKVIFRDPDNDLALLKIDGSNYPVLPLGDSDQIKVGEGVFGIGNAFGRYANTVASGSVAALNRQITAVDDLGPETLNNIIRTDVQLYPGDSGGPLIDMAGNAVGIDVAASQSRNNVSFSIPINDAKSVIATAINQDLAQK